MKRNSHKPTSATPPAASSPSQDSNLTYEAVYISEGMLRKVWFEAASLQDARAFAAKNGFGLQGVSPAPAAKPDMAAEPAGAYNSISARRYLGGISRTQLYRLLTRRKLKRTKHTRRVLVTRESMDAYLKDVEG